MDVVALLSGLQLSFTPLHLIMIFLGTFLGVIVGAIPGLNGPMAIVLLTPFTLVMPFSAGFLMAVGIYAGQLFGGSITAILFKAPGTEVAAATVIDGNEAAKRGRALEALSTAIFSSAIGGMIGLVVLILFAPLLAEVALMFSPADYFSFIFFGLVIIATLLAESPLKGLIMMAFGLFLTTIGLDPLTGTPRFTFGMEKFLLGFHMIPVLIGLYPMAEVFSQVINPTANRDGSMPVQKYHFSFKKALQLVGQLKWAIFRGGIIGVLIGILPGVGGPTATYLAYADAKRASKHKEEFGKGSLEGIAAPEAANNASAGGALVPLLSLGIPGSLTTAVMIGLFVAHGLQPGPMYFIQNQDVIYAIYVALFLSNLFLIPFGIFGSAIFSKFLKISLKIVYPVIFGISITGAFTVRNSFIDVIVAIVFSMFGYFLHKNKWPVAPLVVGMVLGHLIENNFRNAMTIHNNDVLKFFTRPVSAVFLSLAILILLFPVVKTVFRKLKTKGSTV